MATSRNDGLTMKQERAIAALLAQPTIEKAADEAGVSRQTLHRWLGEPAFNEAFRKARREAFTHAVSMAQKYAPAMLNTLASIALDKAATQSARVAASKAVLDYGRESLELDDMARRLERLEAGLEARARGGPERYQYRETA